MIANGHNTVLVSCCQGGQQGRRGLGGFANVNITYQRQGEREDGVHASGTLPVGDCALCCNDRLDDSGVDDAEEEGGSIQGSQHISQPSLSCPVDFTKSSRHCSDACATMATTYSKRSHILKELYLLMDTMLKQDMHAANVGSMEDK